MIKLCEYVDILALSVMLRRYDDANKMLLFYFLLYRKFQYACVLTISNKVKFVVLVKYAHYLNKYS